jgi:hypothetical protein
LTVFDELYFLWSSSPDSSEDNETVAEESTDANKDVDEREDSLDQGQEDQQLCPVFLKKLKMRRRGVVTKHL